MKFPAKFLAATMGAVLSCGFAAAQQFTVETGTTKPLRLSKAAASVVIGNQNVADVAVADPHLVFLTGKSFGTTNLLVLDDANNIIYSADVVVTTNSASLVTINRGGASFTYDCAPDCRDAPMIGDEEGHFQRALSQAQAAQNLTEGSR
ncbi:pilus assembly protein N-terminal domain-containing protein [Henriciella sp. AS95]|uniref:pilus assembly protein N-terminal domain-containing protein n=1 Tax=Henriciella sp. AS95 TaxID=3135782 RepID=UPI0031752D76